MRPCACGRAVRLGAMRVTFDRRRGVAHYIVHSDDSSKPCLPGAWTCAMLKPYPKRDEDKPRWHMVQRWEGERQQSSEPSAPSVPASDSDVTEK